MKIHIRKASYDDIPALLKINESSFITNELYDPYIDMNWIHTSEARSHFEQSITDKNYYALVAEVNKNSVGFLFLSPKQFSYRTVKMIELDIVAVLPEYRSKGIGKALVNNAKLWAKSNGFQTIYVSSYIRNTQSIAFYEHLGFIPIDMSLELTL